MRTLQCLCCPSLSVGTAFLFKSNYWFLCQLLCGRRAASWSVVAERMLLIKGTLPQWKVRVLRMFIFREVYIWPAKQFFHMTGLRWPTCLNHTVLNITLQQVVGSINNTIPLISLRFYYVLGHLNMFSLILTIIYEIGPLASFYLYIVKGKLRDFKWLIQSREAGTR